MTVISGSGTNPSFTYEATYSGTFEQVAEIYAAATQMYMGVNMSASNVDGPDPWVRITLTSDRNPHLPDSVEMMTRVHDIAMQILTADS